MITKNHLLLQSLNLLTQYISLYVWRQEYIRLTSENDGNLKDISIRESIFPRRKISETLAAKGGMLEFWAGWNQWPHNSMRQVMVMKASPNCIRYTKECSNQVKRTMRWIDDLDNVNRRFGLWKKKGWNFYLYGVGQPFQIQTTWKGGLSLPSTMVSIS